jgi:hypothetical protein
LRSKKPQDRQKILNLEAEKLGIQLDHDAWQWLMEHHEHNLLAAKNSLMRVADTFPDIKQIQTALELYYNDAQQYPTTVTASGSIYSTTSGTTTYMQVVPAPPTPPVDHTQYTYSVGSTNGASYTLQYFLEGNVGNITAGLHTATNASIQ